MAFKMEVNVDGYKWDGNAIRVATEAEADAYGKDLYSRWTLVKKYRVVPSDDAVNYAFVNGQLVSASAAAVTVVTKHIGILIAKDGSSRMVCPANGIAFSQEEIGLYCGGGRVLVENERNADYQQDHPELMTRERLQ